MDFITGGDEESLQKNVYITPIVICLHKLRFSKEL